MKLVWSSFNHVHEGFKRALLGPKNIHTWQPADVPKGPNWSQMVNLTCAWSFFYHFGPVCTFYDLSGSNNSSAVEQVLFEMFLKGPNGLKMIQNCPNGPKMVPNDQKHWTKSTLLVADNPEAKHVDAPGLHLLHVLLKLGGERNSQKAGFKLALFSTETGISMVTGGSCCPLIGWNKSWSGSVQTPPGPTRH